MNKLTWDQADFQACLTKARADAATLRVQLLAAGKAVPSEPQLSGDLFEDVELLEVHVAVLRASIKIGPATTTPQPIVTQPTAPKMMTPPTPPKPLTLTEQCLAANAKKGGAK